jgi:hypothetical protein
MGDDDTIIVYVYPDNSVQKMLMNVAKQAAENALEMVGYHAKFDVNYDVYSPDVNPYNEKIRLTLLDID